MVIINKTMAGFFTSFLPILKNLRKFYLEIIILSLAIICGLASSVIFLKSNQSTQEEDVVEEMEPAKPSAAKIMVDIAGSVNKPGVYEVAQGARIKDALQVASGLSETADQDYFSRNFNLARLISDQEKIYIPSKIEVQSGFFSENGKAFDYTSPVDLSIQTTRQIKTNLININLANADELDSLPGVGQVTAQKIIQNRPYKTTEELLSRKIVKKSAWEQIKNLVTN